MRTSHEIWYCDFEVLDVFVSFSRKRIVKNKIISIGFHIHGSSRVCLMCGKSYGGVVSINKIFFVHAGIYGMKSSLSNTSSRATDTLHLFAILCSFRLTYLLPSAGKISLKLFDAFLERTHAETVKYQTVFMFGVIFNSFTNFLKRRIFLETHKSSNDFQHGKFLMQRQMCSFR